MKLLVYIWAVNATFKFSYPINKAV